jgi:hypothetical protein
MRTDTDRVTGRAPLPALLVEVADLLLLLRVHADHRLTLPWNAAASSLMYRNCASRSGCLAPSRVREAPWRLNPLACNTCATVSRPTRCPTRVSWSARCRNDLVVHRNGDIGSPGSTNLNNAGASSGSRSTTLLRPAPGRRTRPGCSTPAATSSAARDTRG